MRSSFALAALVLLACEGAAHSPVAREIPGDAFGVVGDSVMALDLLSGDQAKRRQQQAQGSIRDELFRKEAEVIAPHAARAVHRGVLARHLTERLEEEAAASRPVTAADLEAEKKRRWLEFDRPRSVRTVQVLFHVPKLAPDVEYFERAQKVHEAVQGSHNLNEFANAARTVIEEKEAEVYEMPPLAADGRVVPLNATDRNIGYIQPELARAAASLEHAGDISHVVGSEMGYHIFFATEVIPAHRPPIDEIRDELTRSVLAQRIAPQLDGLVKDSKIPVVRKRDDITKLLTLITEQ